MKKSIQEWQEFVVCCDRTAVAVEKERGATTVATDIDRMANYIDSRLLDAQKKGMTEILIDLPAFGWALTEVNRRFGPDFVPREEESA